MKLVSIIASAFLVVAASATLVADGVNLKRSPKVGDEAKYKIKASFDIQGTEATFSANTSEKVTKVEANGNYTLETKQTDAKVKFGDQDMDVPEGGTDTQTSTALGAVIEIKGEQTGPEAYRLANMNALRVQDKVVNVGDTWKVELKKDSKLGTEDAVANYKVEKMEKVGSFDTVVISFDYKETTGSDPASAIGKAWINVKDGSLVKLEADAKNAPFPGSPGPMNAKIVVERTS